MELSEAILARRSIRRYTAQPVERATVERVLDAARWAPSAHNRQPWRFAVITDEARRGQLAHAMGDQLRTDRRADGDPPELIEQDVSRSIARISQAPVVIVVCLTLGDMDHYPDARRQTAERLMATQSVAMATQNLLLTAHAEGLGACWLCAPLFCPDTVSATLSLPADWEPQALITLGYPANTGKPATRQPLETRVIFS